jgi:hypothetical protein
MWSYAIYDTITGVRQGPVTPSKFTFSRRINEGGSGSMSLVIPVEDLTREQLRALFTPWARTVVAMWNGSPIYAGLITSSSRSGNTVTFDHKDIRALLAKRSTFGSNGYSGDQTVNHSLPLENYPLAVIVAFLVWSATEGPTSNFGVPIYIAQGRITNALVHSLAHSGTNRREYFDYEFTFVGAAIQAPFLVGRRARVPDERRDDTSRPAVRLQHVRTGTGAVRCGRSRGWREAVQRHLLGR